MTSLDVAAAPAGARGRRETSCRSCGVDGLRTFLALGDMPLPDALLRRDELELEEPHFPLSVAFCPSCSLVQVLEEVAPERLFVDNYLYFSSFSDELMRHAHTYADRMIGERGLGSRSRVVEIASNDGYLLRHFAERGVPVLGIDPAPDQARAAEAVGVPTLREFFDVELARRLAAEGPRADLIVANNVMAHTPTLNSFVAGLATLLADDGVATIENTYVRDLIDRCEFDTIYHEHFCYFSCSAVDALMRRHGLVVTDVEHFPQLQGGTLRWHVARDGRVERAAREFVEDEQRDGVTEFRYYETFGERVERIRDVLLELLHGLKSEGRTIAAYGAAAKGSTLLNYAGIGVELVDFVVDRNPHKQGLYMPGVHVPILAPSALAERRPDYVLLLAWNYRDEVLRQQADYVADGGRFIVPVPEPVIL